MADYIDRSIICESYIYVADYHLTKEQKHRLEGLLLDYAKARAPLFFGSEAVIESEAVEGSLKLKVTVVATLANFFIFYGGIRQSIDYLYKDAQTIASAFVTESMFAAGVKSNRVGRTEVRTGVPGALKRIISKLDVLRAVAPTMSPEDFSADLAGIRAELQRIVDTIPSKQDKEAVALGMAGIIEEHYPKPVEQPKEEKGEIPAFIQKRDEIEDFLENLRSNKQ